MRIVPVLAGPTASGKTDLSLRVAEEFGLEIVSADASMVYRGMDIGTAKPSGDERAKVPHHLIDILEPSESFSVSDYLHWAEQAIQDVIDRGKTPLVVGGTGYYIRALSDGLYELPEPDPMLQAELWKEVETAGIEPLLAELEAVSPEDVVRVQRNPRRVVRAVEILRSTGIPPAKIPKQQPKFRYRKFVLWPAWEWLEPRLEQRIERMLEAGLIEEVKGLVEKSPVMSTALQSIGYKEVEAFLRGEYSLEEARAEMLRATRAYAKRQYTWFKKEPGDISFFEGGGEAALETIREWLQETLEHQAYE